MIICDRCKKIRDQKIDPIEFGACIIGEEGWIIKFQYELCASCTKYLEIRLKNLDLEIRNPVDLSKNIHQDEVSL